MKKIFYSGLLLFFIPLFTYAIENENLFLRFYKGYRKPVISPKTSVIESGKLSIQSHFFFFKKSLLEEKNKIQKIFNLKSVNIIAIGKMEDISKKNSKIYLVKIGVNRSLFFILKTQSSGSNTYTLNVMDSLNKKTKILETTIVLPYNRTVIIGLEDKNVYFFISLLKEKRLQHKPKLIKKVRPKYPKIAELKKIQGKVVLEGIVDVKGNVSNINVIDGIDELNLAAVNAFKKWKYRINIGDGGIKFYRIIVVFNFMNNFQPSMDLYKRSFQKFIREYIHD